MEESDKTLQQDAVKSTLRMDSDDYTPKKEDEKPSPKPSPPPDGGFAAWLQCAAAFALFFNAWGIVNTFGETAPFTKTLDLPQS